MKHEYHEGPDAKERFDELAKKIFQTPKSAVKQIETKVRKPKKTSKD